MKDKEEVEESVWDRVGTKRYKHTDRKFENWEQLPPAKRVGAVFNRVSLNRATDTNKS